MTIAALPTPPTRSNPTNFATQGDAFMSSLPQFVSDCNALAAGLNSLAAGGAYAIPYTIDLGSTTDADPGNGKLRFDNATQNLATTLRLDLVGADTNTYTAVLDTFDASTSTVKGAIRIVKQGDITKFLMFSVTARTAPTGYRDISVTPIASSSANPFVSGDAVMLYFQRSGDLGAPGTISVMHVREEQAQGVVPSSPILISTGIYRRVLNTVKTNDITSAALSSNQVTLPAGKYKFRASAATEVTISSGGVCHHKTAIYNVTDASYAAMGASSGAVNPGASSAVFPLPRSQADCVITLTASKVFEIRTVTEPSGSIAGGSSVGSGGGIVGPEVYTEFIIDKIA